MTETETLPPQVDEMEWQRFVRELRLARPWIFTMAIIDIILGAMYLPLGAGNIVVGVMLLIAESRLRKFLEGEANSLAAFAAQMKLFFLTWVMVVIAVMVFYFIFLFLYVGFVVLFAAIFIALNMAGKISRRETIRTSLVFAS
ncbi:MAG: hypothetical protein ABIN58_05515 [candidate division WOR-3 bacterium]